jgi:pimeloyl-ACP methyl ester carboxylesterase
VIEFLDRSGVEAATLVGHSMGSLIARRVALRRPDLVERFLALNIIHPWPKLDVSTVLDLWRPVHAYVLSTPVLGERLLRHSPATVRGLLQLAARSGTFTPAELAAFADPLTEPARARATVALYRSFVTRELPALVAGRYAHARLRTPTRLLFGTDDLAISQRVLSGFGDHADDMELELVPGVGHFIVDERPELVTERALAFFGDAGAQA